MQKSTRKIEEANNRMEVTTRNQKALLAEVNESGHAYLSHTRVNGRYALRVAIGGTFTERRHVESLWALLQRLA